MSSTPMRLFVVGLSCALCSACRPPQNQYVAPPPPEVTVGQPKRETVRDYLEFTGTTAGVETVEIRARVQGFVQAIHFQPGSPVEADQLLFTVDQRPFRARVQEAQADVQSKEAMLGLAKVNLDRTQQLLQRDQASDIEMRERQAQYDQAKAAVDLAKATLETAQLNLDYTEVRSPINGHIGRNLVDVGALVGADGPTLMATVVNDSAVYAYFDASEADLLNWLAENPDPNQRDAKGKSLPVWLATSASTGFDFEGKFDSADNQVDAQTGTIRLRAMFDNRDQRLLAGLFVRVRLPRGAYDALLLPDTAVSADQAGRFVLVVNDKNIVERRDVEVGGVFDRMRRITRGLSGDERVIVNGIQRARVGRPVTVAGQAAPPTTQTASTSGH